MAVTQFARSAASLSRDPSVSSVLKKSTKKLSYQAWRSAAACSAMPSKTLCGTPAGLSGVCSRNGWSEPRNAAFATRCDPWTPR
ncbi:hypothetical protein SBADM41S_04702 [Streptomyces badius]